MPSNIVSPLANGRVIVNKQTGQAKVGQIVEGLDVQDYLAGLREVKEIPLTQSQDKIDTNTKILGSLDAFKTKVTTLKDKIAVFAERLPGDNPWETAPQSAFNQKKVSVSASNGQSATNYVQFAATDKANPATFNLVVNQLASSDLRKGAISVADNNTALGIIGDFTIATSPLNQNTISITGDMTLNQVSNAINAVSAITGVNAEVVMVDTGNYELKLKAAAVGVPILLADTNGTPLDSLGLSGPDTDQDTLVAKINCDGTDFVRSTNIITDVINNITLTLLSSDPSVTLNGSVVVDSYHADNCIGEFILAYNDLNEFYQKQTKMKDDFSGPEEGADLYKNAYVKELYRSINYALFSGSGSSPEITNLKIMGIEKNPKDGNLYVKDMGALTNAIDGKLTEIKNFFANKAIITNPDFRLASAPTTLPGNISGKNVTVTLSADALGAKTAVFTLDGVDYAVPVTASNSLIKMVPDSSSIFKGFELSYFGTLNDDSSVQTTFSMTRGLMSTLDLTVGGALDPRPVPGQRPPNEDSMGGLLREIKALTKQKDELKTKIDDLKRRIEKDMKSEELKFSKVYEAMAQAQNIKSMLDSFRKADHR